MVMRDETQIRYDVCDGVKINIIINTYGQYVDSHLIFNA